MAYKVDLFTMLFLIATKSHHKPSHKNDCNFTLPIFLIMVWVSIYKHQISHDHVLHSVVFSMANCHFVFTKLIKEKQSLNLVITPQKILIYSQ